jgi:hypothetical protein
MRQGWRVPTVSWVIVAEQTFAQLRHLLGFGVVRLKILLALQRQECLDYPDWRGRFVAEIGHRGQVKAGVEPAKQEVTFDE